MDSRARGTIAIRVIVTFGMCLAAAGTAVAAPWTAGAQAWVGQSSLAGPDADTSASGTALGLGGFVRLLPHPRVDLGVELNVRKRNVSDLTTWSLAVAPVVRGYALVRPAYRIYAGGGMNFVHRLSASISDGEDGRTDATNAIVRRDIELVGMVGVSWRGRGRMWSAELRSEHGLSTIDAETPSLTATTRTYLLVFGAAL